MAKILVALAVATLAVLMLLWVDSRPRGAGIPLLPDAANEGEVGRLVAPVVDAGSGRERRGETGDGDLRAQRVAVPMVHGRVLDDSDGAPVVGCDLYQLDGRIRRHRGRTGSDGAFAFAPVTGDRLVLVVRAPPEWEPLHEETELSATQREGREPVLIPARRLSASPVFGVVDAKKHAREGLQLVVRDDAHVELVRTDARGRFVTETAFRHGTITMRTPNMRFARVESPLLEHSARVTRRERLLVPIRVGPTYPLEIVAPEGAVNLSLVARLCSRELPEASVTFRTDRAIVPRSERPVVRFPLRGSSPKKLRLEVVDERNRWTGVADVSPSGSVRPVAVELVRAGALTVEVHFAGVPLPDEAVAVLEVRRNGESPGSTTSFIPVAEVGRTDDDGRFIWEALRPGTYLIQALPLILDRSAQLATVTAGETTEVSLDLRHDVGEELGEVPVRIRCLGPWRPGKPRARLTRVTEGDGLLEAWTTRDARRLDERGPWTADGDSWTAELRFESVPVGDYVLRVEVPGFEVQPRSRAIQVPTGPQELTCLNDVPLVTLTLHVIDAETGEPLDDFVLRTGSRAFPGEGGRVVAEGIPEILIGKTLSVTAAGHGPAQVSWSELRRVGEELVGEIGLAPGDRNQELRLESVEGDRSVLIQELGASDG